MDKKTRVRACMDRKAVDRPPFAFWHHYAGDDVKGKACVLAHKRFFDETDMDLLKLMADGYRDISAGQTVCDPHDWDHVRVPQPGDAFFTEQLDRLRWTIEAIGDRAPVYYSMFSPYSFLRIAWGDALIDAHLCDPQAREHILPVQEALAQSLARAAQEYITAGAEGILLTFTGAEKSHFTAQQHKKLLAPYDRLVLDAANAARDYNILHFCVWAGKPNDLTLWQDYPGAMAQWDSFTDDLPLEEGHVFFGETRSVVGGFDSAKGTMLFSGDEAQIKQHTKELVRQMGTEGFMVGSGSSYPPDMRHEAVRWIGEALKK